MKELSYILITAARNEETYIEKTIQSVIAQTIPPQKWILISDGSTDRTEEIVSRYAAQYNFIELLRADADAKRNFGSKAKAITKGYEQVRSIDHKYVGILDADVSFGQTYYETVMRKFGENPKLGIGGGILFDRHKEVYIQQRTSTDWSVSGPIQMFRRECYEQIGGYVPVRGGVDAVAEVMARMKGWEVRAFREIRVLHHRPTGGEKGSLWSVCFNRGVEDYLLGYHFLFFLAKCLYRSVGRPYLLGSLVMLCGYCSSWLRKRRRQVSPEFVRYLREEQMNRLRLSQLFLKRSKHG
jgi:glycosyltransferase involved in cell wall biosynthesis